MECFKCEKQLSFENANTIRGSTALDFLCDDCQGKAIKKRNREIERETERKALELKQDENFAREWNERKRNEILAKQKLHDSNNRELNNGDAVNASEFVGVGKQVDKWEIGFHGKVRPCRTFVNNYGSQLGIIETDIYLTIYLNNWNTIVEHYYCWHCAEKIMKIVEENYISGYHKWKDPARKKMKEMEKKMLSTILY